MKILCTIIIFLSLVTTVYSTDREITIRDKDYKIQGYIHNNKIYDKNYKLEGYVDRDKVRDNNYKEYRYLDRNGSNSGYRSGRHK